MGFRTGPALASRAIVPGKEAGPANVRTNTVDPLSWRRSEPLHCLVIAGEFPLAVANLPEPIGLTGHGRCRSSSSATAPMATPLAERYRHMPEQRLLQIALHEAASFTPEALAVLRAELAARGVATWVDRAVQAQTRPLAPGEVDALVEAIRKWPCPECGSAERPPQRRRDRRGEELRAADGLREAALHRVPRLPEPAGEAGLGRDGGAGVVGGSPSARSSRCRPCGRTRGSGTGAAGRSPRRRCGPSSRRTRTRPRRGPRGRSSHGGQHVQRKARHPPRRPDS